MPFKVGQGVVVNDVLVSVAGHCRASRKSLSCEGLILFRHTDRQNSPMNPDVSIFVDDVQEALRRAKEAGMEIVHPLTDEPWGVTRFFYKDTTGSVINIGTHT